MKLPLLRAIYLGTAIAVVAVTSAFIVWHLSNLRGSYSAGLIMQGGYNQPNDESPKWLDALVPSPGQITGILPGSSAEAAGLGTRDHVIAINGIPIDDSETISELDRTVRSGDTVSYTVRSGERERVVRLRLIPTLSGFRPWFSLITDLLVAAAFLGIGFLVFTRRAEDLRARLFFIFSMSAGCSYLLIPIILQPNLSPIGIRFVAVGMYALSLPIMVIVTYLLSTSLLHLALVFPKPLRLVQRRPELSAWIYALPVTLIALLFLTGLFVGLLEGLFNDGMTRLGPFVGLVLLGAAAALAVRLRHRFSEGGWLTGWVRHPWPTAACTIIVYLALTVGGLGLLAGIGLSDGLPVGWGFLLIGSVLLAFIAIPFVYPGLACVALVAGYRQADVEEKRQLRWPLWGTIVALAGTVLVGLTVYVFTLLPLGGIGRHLNMSYLVIKALYVLIPISFAIGIFKYRLMDIDVIIRKTVIYTAVTGILLVAFFAQAAVAGAFLALLTGTQSLWGIVLATLGAGALLLPLHRRVQRFVDRRFFKSKFDYPRALAAMEHAAAEATERGVLTRRLAEMTLAAMHCRALAVFLQTDASRSYRIVEAIGMPDGWAERGLLAAEAAFADSRTVHREELAPAAARLWQKMGLEVAAPVRVGGAAAGLLAVGRKQPARHLEEEDLDFLVQAAGVLGDGLARLRLRQQHQDLELARDIQRQLLPQQIPVRAGMEIAAAWQPSRGVGGDYYDVIELGDGRLAVALADVAGKGMSAALLMSNQQAALRALTGLGLPPRELCERLNRTLHPQMPAGRFITLFYAEYDPASRRLTYVNAGHCPPLLVRPDGRAQRLEEGGLFLGPFPKRGYVQGAVELAPGDRLVLYTDGVAEAEDGRQEQFGEDRLLAMVRDGIVLSAAELVRRIEAAVQDHCNGEPQDDLTLLVLAVV
ncbi:MAG TPA: SpoIIE family protein phosphatase [Acidobacteriota bacterium]|nr:SpoIIE family protein phosphatase [Acidobacteriota bacterium]HQF88082.1 SpoIIE family protein phosphatase [Acidobacteriota bacterium]HQG92108.1 SpoIIE family protein phosphatase [Acidobacteriota bacterium]HQK86201.1 SpoIIE family protein phosphatase [Acidobacteriota bacterium]